MRLHHAIELAAFLCLAGCGGGDAQEAAGPTPPASPPPTAPTETTPASNTPVAVVKRDLTTYTVPGPFADAAWLARLEDGRIVVQLNKEPTEAPYARWTEEDKPLVAKGATELAALVPGTTIILPASRYPRNQLPPNIVADGPPDCPLVDYPDAGIQACSYDATTATLHAPRGWMAFQERGRIHPATHFGPNVTGSLLTLSSVDVEGNWITLFVTGMTLGDVFESVDVPAVAPSPTAPDGFVSMTDPFAFDFSGRTLYAAGPVTLKLKKGRVEIRPAARTSFKMAGFSLEEAGLAVRGNLHLDAELDLGADESLSQSFERAFEATLFEAQSPLPPVMAGPVPIAQSLKFTLLAKCTIEVSASAHVTAGTTLDQTITLGGHYTKASGFASDVDVTIPMLVASGPTFTGSTTTSASCAVEGRFSLLVYGVIGPYVSLSAATGFQATKTLSSPIQWQLDGTVAANAGVESQVTIPGLGFVSAALTDTLAQSSTNLFTRTTILAKSH